MKKAGLSFSGDKCHWTCRPHEMLHTSRLRFDETMKDWESHIPLLAVSLMLVVTQPWRLLKVVWRD